MKLVKSKITTTMTGEAVKNGSTMDFEIPVGEKVIQAGSAGKDDDGWDFYNVAVLSGENVDDLELAESLKKIAKKLGKTKRKIIYEARCAESTIIPMGTPDPSLLVCKDHIVIMYGKEIQGSSGDSGRITVIHHDLSKKDLAAKLRKLAKELDNAE